MNTRKVNAPFCIYQIFRNVFYVLFHILFEQIISHGFFEHQTLI